MNLFADESYENGTDWVYGGAGAAQAVRTDALGARTGSWAVLQSPIFTTILGVPTQFVSWHRQTVTTTVGVAVPVSIYASTLALTGACNVSLLVDGVTEATVAVPALGAGFTLLDFGTFTPTGTSHLLTFESACALVGQSAQILFDDAEAIGPDGGSDVAIGKHLAMAALVTALKTINGSPYWTTLESRVYTRLVLPDDSDVSLPYACVPLYAESERVEYGSRHASSKWSVLVHFFTKDNLASDRMNTQTQATCSQWRDDLIRCLMTDQYLATTCKNVEIAQINTFAGGDGMGYSEVVAQIDFWQVFGTADLGPTA